MGKEWFMGSIAIPCSVDLLLAELGQATVDIRRVGKPFLSSGTDLLWTSRHYFRT